uniref:(California timema) hypothetical protein n=1 Tax=Timema californicum TaxID=61474 RepID=A0A7R9JAT9_TIMCA|nr:unnamed protein product [Timema californicum]
MKAYIHNPWELPDSTTSGNLIPPQWFMRVGMLAWSMYTTEEVRGLSVRQRRCRFPHESNLLISPIYSYNLCRMQCRMLLAHRLCGCVPHFYRRTGTPTIVHLSTMAYWP